jgi:lipoate-protein ligase A
VETLTCQVLPFSRRSGPENMAADEAMLHSAGAGVASLRFYGWTEATVSLGYFQPAAVRNIDPRVAALPFVRRPTGGGTLVHDQELTYALALPAGRAWQGDRPWLPRMHALIAAALQQLGVPCELSDAASATSQVLCFQQVTPGDVICRGAKIVGSAQRKHRQCLVQHGAILLAASPHAPMLPGIFEQAGRLLDVSKIAAAVLTQLCLCTGWQPEEGGILADKLFTELVKDKYAQSSWNLKR